MDGLLTWFKGKRTYLVAVAIALATFAHNAGLIDVNTYQLIVGLLGAGAVATLRAGIKNP